MYSILKGHYQINECETFQLKRSPADEECISFQKKKIILNVLTLKQIIVLCSISKPYEYENVCCYSQGYKC